MSKPATIALRHMTPERCAGCLVTVLTEYPDDFERALGSLSDEASLGFYGCYDDNHGYGACMYCLRIRMKYVVGSLDILMIRLDGDMHVECSLPFYEAAEIVGQYMPSRVQLAFHRLRSNALVETN